MAVHSLADIQRHFDSFERDLRGRSATSYTNSELHNLSILAVMCGYPTGRMGGIERTQLKTLYDTAAKRIESAVLITAAIARVNGVKLDDNAAPALPDPEPAPSAPVAPPLVTGDYITREIALRMVVAHTKETLESAQEYADHQDENCLEAITLRIDTIQASIPHLIQTALQMQTPTHLVVSLPNAEPVAVGLVHKATPRIIRALAAGLNVYLHGPAGSGKTTTGRKCAEALKLPFYAVAKVESEYLLMGFRDAKGDVVRTAFREAYEHGGVFLFDELDASSPGAIVALNMALANGVCSFPDGLIPRHPDFKCLAAGNTTLTGATRQYAGRSQMDAASIDRFYFIEFGYDEALEAALATNKVWCAHVQNVRAAIAERGISHLVTPRATFDGCKALAIGDTWAEAEMSCIFKGLDSETVDALRRKVKDMTPDVFGGL